MLCQAAVKSSETSPIRWALAWPNTCHAREEPWPSLGNCPRPRSRRTWHRALLTKQLTIASSGLFLGEVPGFVLGQFKIKKGT